MEPGCESKKGPDHLVGRSWILTAAIIGLVAVHGIVLQYVISHLRLSAAAVAGVMVVVTIKHVGLLGPAYAWLRRYFRRER